MENNLIDQFLLDPTIHFLNHGSFGACPRPVFEIYQHWQRRLENQPVLMLGREITGLMHAARGSLAAYLNCAADELVYFPNPTTAINMVARNLDLQPGDEILTSDHEYGAMDRTWRFIAAKTGARYLNLPIPLPVTNQTDFVENFWDAVSERTKVIFLSHITSQTALIFPVAEICRRAKQAGILTIIDGAHAPSQIPVDLQALQADIYTGACHKWLCAPKGSAFLYASKAVQAWLEPLVVSWGYQAESPSASQYIDYHEWQGTRDMSAFLSVPAAIQFQAEHNWPGVRKACHERVVQARRQLIRLTGISAICPEDEGWFSQMAAIQLPELDPTRLQARLYAEYQVEVPIYRWNGNPFLRISIQAYNTAEDIEALLQGLADLLPQESR